MYTDFGYMEEGKLGRPYDWRLLARLWTFLRRYWGLMGFSLLIVLVMAGLDLLVPYLTKEAIDRYILPHARVADLRGVDRAERERFLKRFGEVLIPMKEEERFLLPSEVLRSMDRKEASRYQKAGLLSEGRYYLFIPQGEEEAIIGKYPEIFSRTGPYVYLPLERARELAWPDRIVLRGRDIAGVFHLALLTVLVLAIHFGLNFLQVYTIELAGQRMMHDLRMRVFTHLQELPLSFFDRNPVGRLVTRLTNDVQNVHEMFTSVFVNLFRDVILLFGIMILLLYLDRGLALVSFAVLPLIFLTTLLFSRLAREAFREIRFKVAQMNSFLQEHLAGIAVVQHFRREEEDRRRFGKINEAHYLANMRQITLYAFFVPLIEILSTGATGLLIWYGGGKVIQEALSLGVLVAFLSYIRMFFQPIRDLSEKYNIMQSAMASLERIFGLLDEKGGPSLVRSPIRRKVLGQIEFQEVSFSYNGKDRVLHQVSFAVKPGETVAIVGATGSGKTTLFSLLERFYEPEEGRILLDGIDLREWDLRDLRSQFGLVMQDTFLFAGEIEENITMGKVWADRDQVREVARLVNAHSFIERLPQGYRTRVGEGGEVLSSGQRQLLAFARALYVDPRVLLLDEATSHVDPETERLIQDGLVRLLRGRTALIIAHRLSTIQHADRIVVLHKGKVREIGTHAELIAQKGYYFRLYQVQFGIRGLPSVSLDLEASPG
ncbi:MAG: ABC transporter ATP-binding protein/permease [Desulfobacterota bacterium]|nr:ABC transporter ATP-binding protein/permease [Thermodesulfobacteriota bacterium]